MRTSRRSSWAIRFACANPSRKNARTTSFSICHASRLTLIAATTGGSGNWWTCSTRFEPQGLRRTASADDVTEPLLAADVEIPRGPHRSADQQQEQQDELDPGEPLSFLVHLPVAGNPHTQFVEPLQGREH